MADSDEFDAAAHEARERLFAWAARLDEHDYYELLGVDELAHEVDIRSAYHRFALAFHPDSHIGADEPALAAALRIFQRGTEAYRVLAHPELRVRYDVGRSRGRLRLLPSDVPARLDAERAARPLHELCRSAGAKLSAQKAARLIDAGDLASARRELQRALEFDGGNNPAVQERIEALDVALYAMGEPS